MAKKCIMCKRNADLMIKGTSDFYCRECAVEQFGDIEVLVSVDDEAGKLKKKVDDIITQADEILKEQKEKEDMPEESGEKPEFTSQIDEIKQEKSGHDEE